MPTAAAIPQLQNYWSSKYLTQFQRPVKQPC